LPALTLPGFVLWTMREPNTTTSLSGHVIDRLFAIPSIEPPAFSAEEFILAPPTVKPRSVPKQTLAKANEEGITESFYIGLTKELKRLNRDQLRAVGAVKQLDAWLVRNTAPTASGRTLADFAIASFRDHGKSPRSVYAQVTCVGPYLIALAEDLPLESITLDEWTTIYETALADTATTSGAGNRVRYLHEFHRQMSRIATLPKLNFKALDGYYAASLGVRANVVLPDEFRRAETAFLQHRAIRNQDAHVQWMPARLGYYGGLRPAEVYSLRLGDVIGTQQLEIIIRPYGTHRLKTPSARRRVPIALLLPPEVFESFRESVLRARQNHQQEEFLCKALDPNFPEALTNARAIGAALRAACDDGEIVMYTLRHSFVNWTLLRLSLVQFPELRRTKLPLLQDVLFEVGACRSLFDSLMPSQRGYAIPGSSRYLHVVSKLVGHLSPRTTLGSYSHLSHLLAWELMRAERSFVPVGVLSQWLGVSKTAIMKKLDAEDGP
jgi:integrase